MSAITMNDSKVNDKHINGNLPLPSDKIPKCWEQEERMSALFSPFRSRSANSQDWISKHKFWCDMIYECLKYNMKCSFSIIELNEAFKRKGCAPLCLITVIEELLKNNTIILEDNFLKEPCETWAAWSVDTFIKRPISWSFHKIKSYTIGESMINTEVRYIHLQIVHELGDIILSMAEVTKDNVLYPISEVVEYCKSKTEERISLETIKLVLEWLRGRRKVAFKRSSDQNNELLIKISTQTVAEITDIEEGTYKLTQQENKLIKEIEFMEQEKLNVIKEVKTYLAKELRQVAKTHLRRKMELEKTIEKRAQALANLRTLIVNIEDAHSNSAVLSAYKTGSDVLKKMGRDDLTEFGVANIMDDINDLLEENKEVNSILSETLNNVDSDAELEKELAELLNEDSIDNSIDEINSEPNSEVEKLEQRLNNLRMEGLVLPEKNINALPSKSSQKERINKPRYSSATINM